MTSPSGAGVTVTWEARADVVVVGGGVAGLTAARTATLRGLTVLTVGKPADTATQYAQGGIAVVSPATGDSVDSHSADTCAAGAGLCDEAAVRSIVSGGRDAVAALADLGAVFDHGRDGSMARTREGGHSTRRIIHAGGDATGAEVQRALITAGLPVLCGAAARVLTDARGVTGLLMLSDQGFGVIHAPAVLLATGGLGQLYACSTNPPGATADGIALALDAGASVADLEFVQFHPTVLFTPGALGRRPLISEAVRGEGAELVDAEGNSVTAGVHPRGDLAPRDVVSRAIAARLRRLGTDHVYLDARRLSNFAERFPTVTASCLAAGIDPRAQLIPVAPAAHYACGGVVTDVHGRTAVPGLYAAGEVARTGLHGANRLASNSLLEGLVVGARAGAAAGERAGLTVEVRDPVLRALPRARRDTLQQLMTAHAAVVRDGAGLAVAAAELAHAPRGIADHAAALEDAALTLTATALVRAAGVRTESRGCHTRSDHPEPVEAQRRSIEARLGRDGELELRVPQLTGAL